MDIITAIIMGLIQGITEWIPVSSTGHLVLAEQVMRLNSNDLILFKLVLHAATLLSVTFFLRKELARILPAMFKGGEGLSSDQIRLRKIGWLALIATIPIAIAGIVESRFLQDIFASAFPTAIFLLFTGVMLWVAEIPSFRKEKQELGLRDTVVIGCFQAVSVLPGISRSGSTISAGCYLGYKRETVAIFSFLLSIPAIILALAYGLVFLESSQIDWGATVVAAAIAAITGVLALKWLFSIIQKKKLRWFAVYCWALGLTVIVLVLYFNSIAGT